MPTQRTHRFSGLMDRVASWLQPDLRRGIQVDARARSWARHIRSYNELPGLYRPFANCLAIDQRQPLPYLVLTPDFQGIGRRPEVEKLVALAGKALHVVEQRDGQLVHHRFPLRGQCRVDRVLLLYSGITVHATSADCAVQSATLRFNSVSDQVMEPFVDALRARPHGDPSASPEPERARFNHPAQTPYKFYCHGRNRIRPGDRVLQVLLQPEVRSRKIRLFGCSISRRAAPAHLTILTDTEIMMIRDDERQSWINGQAPGTIWNHIPRRPILKASLDSEAGVHRTLTIESSGRPTVQAVFSHSAQPELEDLMGSLRK